MPVIVPFPLKPVDEADTPLPQGILKGPGLHELRFILIAAEVSNRFKAISPCGISWDQARLRPMRYRPPLPCLSRHPILHDGQIG